MELLARTQPGDHDFDIPVGIVLVPDAVAGQFDHAPGEVHDLHGLAHVEDEDFAMLRHGCRLQNQLGGFGNGHEIAADVRMGQRHRPACLDLVAEQRNDRTARIEHVAEPDGGKHRVAHEALPLLVRHGVGLAEGLDDHFGEALGCPHDVGRAHGLVGRNQHETSDPVADSRARDIERADRVGLETLDRIGLDNGHMLVGRGMENHVGPDLADDRVDPRGKADGREKSAQARSRAQPFGAGAAFMFDLVERNLGVVEQHQFLGTAL